MADRPALEEVVVAGDHSVLVGQVEVEEECLVQVERVVVEEMQSILSKDQK